VLGQMLLEPLASDLFKSLFGCGGLSIVGGHAPRYTPGSAKVALGRFIRLRRDFQSSGYGMSPAE
jgi:hypothetical protein